MRKQCIYDNVKIAMIKNHITNYELAQRLGIEYNKVCRLLRRATVLTLDMAIAIRKALNEEDVDLDVLFQKAVEQDG